MNIINRHTDLKTSYKNFRLEIDRKDFLLQVRRIIKNFTISRFQLDEDEISEIFTRFIEKLPVFDTYIKNNKIQNFPAFLNTFVKNIILNFTREKTKHQENILFIGSKIDEIADDYDSSLQDHNLFKILDLKSKLILKLRHNLAFDPDDQVYLNMIIQLNRIEDFHVYHAQKLAIYNKKKEQILKKIYKQHPIFSKNSKKDKLIKKYLKFNKLYSFKEISFLMNLSISNVRNIYFTAICNLKISLTKKNAA